MGVATAEHTHLPAPFFGLASVNAIDLDMSAAGWGWFVDKTPHNDSEFVRPGNQGEQNRMELLTVLEHEVGHLLGFESADTGVMIDTLPIGSRRAEVDGRDGDIATVSRRPEVTPRWPARLRLFGRKQPARVSRLKLSPRLPARAVCFRCTAMMHRHKS